MSRRHPAQENYTSFNPNAAATKPFPAYIALAKEREWASTPLSKLLAFITPDRANLPQMWCLADNGCSAWSGESKVEKLEVLVWIQERLQELRKELRELRGMNGGRGPEGKERTKRLKEAGESRRRLLEREDELILELGLEL
jgi:hypothetical protein